MGMGFQVFILFWLILVTLIVATTNVYYRPMIFMITFLYSALTSWANGSLTAIVMKYFGATDWLFSAFASAICLPAYLFSILVIVDIIEYVEHASNRQPPWSLICMGAVWLCIAVPVSFAGAHYGFRQPKLTTIKVNSLQRKRPELPCYLKRRYLMPIFGLIIFASVFGEF